MTDQSAPALDVTSTVQRLCSAELFQTLSCSILERLVRASVPRNLDRGYLLFSEGTAASFAYVVMRGSFRSIRHDANGREQTLAIEQKGSVLGLAGALSTGVYHSTMMGLECTSVLCLQAGVLIDLCRKSPDLLWAMTMRLTAQVKCYAELAAMLSLRSVDEKLALHLVTVAHDRSTRTDQGWALELKATRPEIAAQLGTVREVLSRSFSHLQDRGLIMARGRLITIPNLSALEGFATSQQGQSACGAP